TPNGSRLHGQSGALYERENETVTLVNDTDGPAVRHDIAFEAPLVAQSVKEKMIGASGFAADRVVGAHDGVSVTFRDRGAKRGSIRVGKVARRNRHILAMAQGLRTAVNSKVLGSGNDFQVFGIVALQAGYESNANAAG